MELETLVQADLEATLEFFYFNLKEEVDTKKVEKKELAYVASVLASNALTSLSGQVASPFDSLTQISERFALNPHPAQDPNVLSCAGAEVLFFAGFFRTQMCRRHDVEYFDYLGRSLYQRAGIHTRDKRKRELFGGVAIHFATWTQACSDMHKTFQSNRYLLYFS